MPSVTHLLVVLLSTTRWISLLLVAGALTATAAETKLLDTLTFGAADSEKAHDVQQELTETITGGQGESARRLLARTPATWEGGRLGFKLQVDPVQLNYVTVRFWGSDKSPNLLVLFGEGRQIGYRHLGDYDILDHGTEAPLCHDRFYYTTTPLPLALTKGRTQIQFEIRSYGRIWSYGVNWDQYQKTMTEPTRGIYRIYSHTDGTFVPPATEKQGTAAQHPPLRKQPGPEVITELKERLNRDIDNRLKDKRPLNQVNLQFLARAYFVKWSKAYQNPKVAEQALNGLDNLYRAYVKTPLLAKTDPATPNPDWFGYGICGQVISLLREPMAKRLDEKIDDGDGNQIPRKAAYAEMLIACRDSHRKSRRQYTNQSMINDLYGIYWANRGIAAVLPDKALSEDEAKRYLYESIGLKPWLGSDGDNGPQKPLGADFWQLTPKGLTRELGYVGGYGEVLDWCAQIYAATRPNPDEPGDPQVKAQLIKIAQARAPFRYPCLDEDGFAAMRLETVVGWRDTHFPGDVTYAQRATWDGTPVEVAALTLDPKIIGYVQQMLAENQFYAAVADHLRNANFRIINGVLTLPDDYEAVRSAPPSTSHLPMAAGQPNFVFADETNGVVAIKRGDEILYASLYWRARHAINNLARVHVINPRYDRIATVIQEEEFTDSGLKYRRPDWVNFGFANGGVRYPGDLHSAHAGQELPIAKIPDGLPFKPGQENMHAGRASFYKLRYGNYLIGVNASADQTYTLPLPPNIKQAHDLVTGKPVTQSQTVRPQSTAVLYWLE